MPYCSFRVSENVEQIIESLRCFGICRYFTFNLDILLPSTHIIRGARFAILGHFSAASAATGPFISLPLISPSGVTSTAALSSNVTRSPFNLFIGYFCLTITAPNICLRSSAGPFLTVTVTKSPTAADGNLECLPLYLVTCAIRRTFAPVLSAQASSAVTGSALVIYGRNSSTPLAETALVFAAIFLVDLDNDEGNCFRQMPTFSDLYFHALLNS